MIIIIGAGIAGLSYYKPLDTSFRDRAEWLEEARNPSDNIYFIGEGFSRNQGWVQGSLESVDAIYSKL
uniref:Amine oxidase domain-containing protein n=1 Tax=viral metagenome TaxID=1070528 RepID=A0A6C0KHR0_9ZZZZ